MANSLLPDLNAEQKKKSDDKIIAEFDYDNTNAEVDGAMKTFQYKFSSKRWIMSVVGYSVLLAAAVVMVILDPETYIVYAAILFCALGLFLSLTSKRRMRKKVIQALDSMDPETYHCRIFPDKIEIKTVIQPKENPAEDTDGESEIESGSVPEPVMSVYDFKTGFLDFAENHDSFLLIVARKQFHCFPKRCLSAEQCETVRKTLSEKTRMF